MTSVTLLCKSSQIIVSSFLPFSFKFIAFLWVCILSLSWSLSCKLFSMLHQYHLAVRFPFCFVFSPPLSPKHFCNVSPMSPLKDCRSLCKLFTIFWSWLVSPENFRNTASMSSWRVLWSFWRFSNAYFNLSLFCMHFSRVNLAVSFLPVRASL